MSSPSAESDIYAETLAVFDDAEPGEPLTTPEVAETLELGRRTVYERLSTLADDDALATKKVGSGARVWWRPAAGETDAASADAGALEAASPSDDRRSVELERTAAHLDTVVSNVPIILFAYDSDGTITLSEGMGLETLGFEPGELVGESVFELYGWRDEIIDDIERTLAGEQVSAVREVEDVVFETTYQPVVDDGDGRGTTGDVAQSDDGDVREVIAVSIDVTDRVERERELERYERIIDAVGDPVYELDAEGNFTYANRAFSDKLGYDREELLGRHVSIGMDAADIEGAESLIADVLADDETDSATMEYEVITDDGGRLPVENHLAPLTDEEGRYCGTAGVLRDISERRQRERRYQSLVENLPGIVCLSEVDPLWPLTAVYGECEELTGYTADELLEGEVSWGEDVLHPDDREWIYDSVADALESDGSYEVTYRILSPDGSVRWMWERGNLIEEDLIQAFITDVTDRKEHERQLRRQRERLAALNNLHSVVREITDAVLERSTREDIEQAVCRRLAESDSYEFAWIAEIDPGTKQLVARVESGVEDYLGTITLSADPNRPEGQGPAGRAVRTREMQVSQNVLEDPDFGPWRDEAKTYGFRSCASIPIVHEGTLYGLIGVYSARTDAFAADEREVVGGIGELVGHAISAVERKRALTSDEIVEIGVQLRRFFQTLGLEEGTGGTVEVHRSVPVGNGSYLLYGTAGDGAMTSLERLVESDAAPHWEEITVLRTGESATNFEARLAEAPLVAAISAHGGYLDEMRLVDGDLFMRVHLPSNADISRLVDDLQEHFPGVEPVTRRQKTRPKRTSERLSAAIEAALTERQFAALEAGYYAGYFEWPRDSSGEDVAEALDISPATFHQHVRAAEKKLLQELFDER